MLLTFLPFALCGGGHGAVGEATCGSGGHGAVGEATCGSERPHASRAMASAILRADTSWLRFVRLQVLKWRGKIAMRAGVLVKPQASRRTCARPCSELQDDAKRLQRS